MHGRDFILYEVLALFYAPLGTDPIDFFLVISRVPYRVCQLFGNIQRERLGQQCYLLR